MYARVLTTNEHVHQNFSKVGLPKIYLKPVNRQWINFFIFQKILPLFAKRLKEALSTLIIPVCKSLNGSWVQDSVGL